MSDEQSIEPLPGDRRAGRLGENGPPIRMILGGYRLGRPRGGYDYVIGNRGAWASLTCSRRESASKPAR